MSVSNSWLVNVQVNLNTTVVQPPNFNACAVVGILPDFSIGSPYQCPPSSWAANDYLWQSYSSNLAFQTDFLPILANAKLEGDLLQVNRLQWLINAVSAFYAQLANPEPLLVFALAPQDDTTSYTTFFNTITNANNNFYGCTIADYILPNTYSYVIAQVTTSGALTIPAGTLLSAGSPSSPSLAYFNQADIILPQAGTYNVPFYSLDGTTVYSSNTLDTLTPTFPDTTVTNNDPNFTGLPGYLTATTGVDAGLASLRALANQKKLFQDFVDYEDPGTIQSSGNSSLDLTCFYHSENLQWWNASVQASLAAACLGGYFPNVFVGNNGLTELGSMQIESQPFDPTVTTSNIGTPGTAGGSSNLIGWNNNVYTNFSSATGVGIGLVQYGYVSSSTSDRQIYLDQVVGADFLQFTCQADLVSLLLNSLPSGLPYNDLGIQQIINTFKQSLNVGVAQNIIQPFNNSSISYATLAQVPKTDIANRIYQQLSFAGVFLSRIQRIGVVINLSL